MGRGIKQAGRNQQLNIKDWEAALHDPRTPLDVGRIVDRCYAHAEGVFLKQGRKQWSWRRKETLDLLSNFMQHSKSL